MPSPCSFRLPARLNRLLIGLYRVEARLLGRLRLPVGLSVACLARRAGPGAAN